MKKSMSTSIKKIINILMIICLLFSAGITYNAETEFNGEAHEHFEGDGHDHSLVDYLEEQPENETEEDSSNQESETNENPADMNEQAEDDLESVLADVQSKNFENAEKFAKYVNYFSVSQEITSVSLSAEALNEIKEELSIETISEEDLLTYTDLVFYRAGDSIYRYYLPTETLDLMIEAKNLLSWKPLTNNKLSFSVKSDDYLEAVEANVVEIYGK